MSTSAGARRMTKPNRGRDMVNRMYSRICTVLGVLALFASLPLQATVQAQLDRSRITEGETVTLTIMTDEARQNLDADFSALEKDFAILDRRSETQLSIVNGRQTASVRLILTLEPRAAGAFLIPQLAFGGDTTQAIKVQVDPAPALEPGSQPPVFIEMEVVPAEGPYFVHAQIGLVVRVFYQQNLTEAAISQPDPSPASVRLMQETPYQAERGGERYRVLERTYAVFPERSGALNIPPMQLTGRLVERKSTSVWQPAVRGRRVQVESEALELAIEPKPAEFSGSEWQPARDYRLTQQISSGDALRVGEPVTRTVIVDAVGLEENMIVEPVWPDLPNARIYPDQPQGITRDDGQWVLGHKEFRYAVVPEKEGELVLPELKVDWWDTQNNRARTATLEAHTIFVQPSALVPPPPPVAAPGLTGGETSASLQTAGPNEPAYWRWLALIFAALWLLTLMAAWKLNGRGGREKTGTGSESSISETEAATLSSLHRACKSGDRRQARQALQHWLRDFGPAENNHSLLEFAAGTGDPDISESIYALDAEGFQSSNDAGARQPWNGGAFWTRFEAWRTAQAARSRQSPPLMDLYAKENRPAR
jgi:hypothetical protein